MAVVELALRVGLTAVFLLSAAGKTMAFGTSTQMVSQLLALRRGRAAPLLAGGLIGGEVVAAVLVATADSGIRARVAAAVTLVLCALFAGATVRATMGGRRIACNCFGSLRPTEALGPRTLLRALGLAAATVVWYLLVQPLTISPEAMAQRVAVSFTVSALVASAIAWTHWRRGIPHRRFATEAIRLQVTHSATRRKAAAP